MTVKKHAVGQGITPKFKQFVLFLVMSLTCYRLGLARLMPSAWHVADEVLLTILVILLGYMWVVQTQMLARLTASEMELRDAHVGMLAALVEALEAKDPYIRGHSEEVRRLSVELARKLGLSAERVAVVSRAAVVHDLGKLEIPDAVLHKAEPLTEEEIQCIRKHPGRTATILSPLGFLAEELRVAVLHHERYDGTGYDVGLKGSDIPVEASIIAVADTFDAMNSSRPYRPKLSQEKIVEELHRSRGTQHPPALVDRFLALLAERPELWVRSHLDTRVYLS